VLAERITLNVVVGVVAALLAFVLAAALLADRRDMTTVAVARERIAAGTPITPDLVSSEKVPADTGFASELVKFERLTGGRVVATRTVQPGEPLAVSAVGGIGAATPKRVMSIPLQAAQAANGAIDVGDQVDVIATTSDLGARYVLLGAAVVDRSSDGGGGGLVGSARSSEFVITVEVDADQALELAAAIDGGTITVVRSTGVTAAPPDIQSGAAG
jgi:Flp pilus assembly protein CpaB